MSESNAPLQVMTYPGEYTFRMVAHSLPDMKERVRVLVQSIVGEIPDHAIGERPSAAGKYMAYHVTCMLVSEEQRRDVYLRLKTEPAILMTL